jgi:hypothetical protein
VIERVLNHVSGSQAGVAGIYNRYGYLPEKQRAIELWAPYMEAPCDLRRRASRALPMPEDETEMSYRTDYQQSARRHLEAADHLGSPPSRRRDVAGSLYGVSAELAVKQMMRNSNMRPLPIANRRDDPFYAHFPELKTLLRDRAAGRRQGELRRIADNSRLMQCWDTAMRYAPATDIQQGWVDLWASRHAT